jgi:hypothetical protein
MPLMSSRRWKGGREGGREGSSVVLLLVPAVEASPAHHFWRRGRREGWREEEVR